MTAMLMGTRSQTKLTTAPANEVPLTVNRVLDVAAALDFPTGSPALSANVLRFGSGSLSTPPVIICV
jgi:hypothetical protein